MKVDDYLKCAKKHLDFCRVSVASPESKNFNFLLEVYYLLGYVFEGFAVYLAYKIPYTEKGSSEKIHWNEDNDVEWFDRPFTRASRLAYEEDYVSHISKGVKLAKNHGCLDPEEGYEFYINTKFNDKTPKCNASNTVTEKDFRNQLVAQYGGDFGIDPRKVMSSQMHFHIKGHRFNSRGNVVDKVIRPYFQNSMGMATHPNGPIPYFGTSGCDEQCTKACKMLIQGWETRLRYCYDGSFSLENEIKEKITKENVDKLISVCDKIIELIPCYFPQKRR